MQKLRQLVYNKEKNIVHYNNEIVLPFEDLKNKDVYVKEIYLLHGCIREFYIIILNNLYCITRIIGDLGHYRYYNNSFNVESCHLSEDSHNSASEILKKTLNINNYIRI